jgi:perosamine synthetase
MTVVLFPTSQTIFRDELNYSKMAEKEQMNVPFTDIYVDKEIVESGRSVLQSTRYVKGPKLEEFEQAFAEKAGVEHAVGVSSGTAAILLGLQAANVNEGDDVFVPGHTFFATVSPILSIGANPVFVDIDAETYTMDPAKLADAVDVADDPEAVIPVHIYGQMANMDKITEIAAERDLSIVADACQAHFARRNGTTAGTAADIGAFSFYPSKNMTVGGDGGMLITDDPEIAERARALRNHGRDDSGEHVALGLNYRLDEFKAAVGLEQLRHIEDWNESRNAAAQRYTERLEEIDEVTTPAEATDAFHVYHLYVIQVPDRDDLREYLDERGIDTGIHYETPAHEHPPIVKRCGETELDRTERLVDRIVSLPMHPRITDEEIDYVCAAIEEYYE